MLKWNFGKPFGSEGFQDMASFRSFSVVSKYWNYYWSAQHMQRHNRLHICLWHPETQYIHTSRDTWVRPLVSIILPLQSTHQISICSTSSSLSCLIDSPWVLLAPISIASKPHLAPSLDPKNSVRFWAAVKWFRNESSGNGPSSSKSKVLLFDQWWWSWGTLMIMSNVDVDEHATMIVNLKMKQ